MNAIAHGFGARQPGVLEGPVLAVQVRMRKVADVVNDHGVVGTPGKIERHTGPPVWSLQLGNIRDAPLLGQRRVAGEDPDQSIAHFHRVMADLHAQPRLAEEIVWDVDDLARAVIAPAVVSAG